jgi:hypothetical protein
LFKPKARKARCGAQLQRLCCALTGKH